jgi:hypothetical protein
MEADDSRCWSWRDDVITSWWARVHHPGLGRGEYREPDGGHTRCIEVIIISLELAFLYSTKTAEAAMPQRFCFFMRLSNASPRNFLQKLRVERLLFVDMYGLRDE